MSKIIVCNHTILDYPFEGSKVLDVGSRDYEFANHMAELGCKVWAVEPDSFVKEPVNKNIHLIRSAVVASKDNGLTKNLVKWSTGEGNFIDVSYRAKPATSTLQETSCVSIQHIMQEYNIELWDVVKLDCEGSEYEILREWSGPIAKQITVEFHEFTGANQNGVATYHEILSNLEQWYDIIQHKWFAQPQQTIKNYWDSLFVLKGMI